MVDILLDTNILIDYLRLSALNRQKETKLERLVLRQETKLFISTVTIQELFQGKSTKKESAYRTLSEALDLFSIIALDASIAEHAGKLIRDFEPIEFADASIAATAVTCHMSLFTFNTKDFLRIPNLSIFSFEDASTGTSQ